MPGCLTCTFRARCCSARLSQAQVLAFTGSCPGQDEATVNVHLFVLVSGVVAKSLANGLKHPLHPLLSH